MVRFLCIITVLVFAFGNAACTKRPASDPQIVANPDKVSLMLADAADKAANALQTLAAVEQAKSPGVQVDPIVGAPQELRRAISVTWVGPVEPIVKKLAERAGYTFVTIGNAPNVPLVVNLDVENTPVIDVMRDVGLQMGQRANLRVNAELRIVEIQYAPISFGREG